MPMMDIGVVLVRVRERRMGVAMRMRLRAVPTGDMLVLVVHVVAV